MKDETVQYFQWFADGTMQLRRTEDSESNTEYLAAEFRGPLKQPIKFKLSFEYDLI